MALEDPIRSSIDTALGDLTSRLDQDLRALVQHMLTREEHDAAVAAVRREAREEAAADIQRRIAEAHDRARATIDEAVNAARSDERLKAAHDMRQLVEAEMAELTRVLDGVRAIDAATSLGEVLDALGQSAGREASRAAVLVLRNDRLLGWKLCGFGVLDTQSKTIDVGLNDSGVIALAVSGARPVTTRDTQRAAQGPGFTSLPVGRMGFAVPVIVGGRVVAVVYADSVTTEGQEHVVPSGWPEVIELLARHAGRCLEALTIQKTASPQSPRFSVPGVGRPNPASVSAAEPQTETSSPSDSPPPGTMT
jgi:hypothetical protein